MDFRSDLYHAIVSEFARLGISHPDHANLTKAKVGSTFVGAADWLRHHGEALPLYLESGPGPPTGFSDMHISPWL